MAIATTAEPNGPLSQTQQHEVAAAHDRAQKIRKAAAVARFNAWMTGIAAVCSAPFAIFSLPGFLVTVGLSFVAYNELKGRRRLLRFDQKACAFLAWNQLGFLALIAGYSIWMLAVGLTSEGPFAAGIKAQPELSTAFQSVDELDQAYRTLIILFYGTVLALSLLFQGLNALYYFSRQKYVAAHVQNTPKWVLDLQHLTPPA